MGGQGNYLKQFLSHVLAASVTLWLTLLVFESERIDRVR